MFLAILLRALEQTLKNQSEKQNTVLRVDRVLYIEHACPTSAHLLFLQCSTYFNIIIKRLLWHAVRLTNPVVNLRVQTSPPLRIDLKVEHNHRRYCDKDNMYKTKDCIACWIYIQKLVDFPKQWNSFITWRISAFYCTHKASFIFYFDITFELW